MKKLKLLLLIVLSAFSSGLYSQGPDITITDVNIVDEGCALIGGALWSYQQLEITVSNVGDEPFTAPYGVTSELALSGESISVSDVIEYLLEPGESAVLSGQLNSIGTPWTIGQSNILTVSMGAGGQTETGDALLNNTYEIFQTEDVDCSNVTITDAELTYAISCNEDENGNVYLHPQLIVENLGPELLYSYCLSVPDFGYTKCLGLGTPNNVANFPVSVGGTLTSQLNSQISWFDTFSFDINTGVYEFTANLYDVNVAAEQGGQDLIQSNNSVTIIIDTDNWEQYCNPGCNDNQACNYYLLADYNDGSCVYADDPCEICEGSPNNGTGYVTLQDADGDGVCDGDEIVGCQDDTACNYDASATDAGSCVYADGNCEVCDGNGGVAVQDADGDGVCDGDEIVGCQDDTACNYDASATDNDDCVYATGCDFCSGETDGTGTIVDGDVDDDGVCDVDEVIGCMNSTACNYNSAATDPGVDCIYATGCDSCSGETDGTGTVVDGDSDDDGICDGPDAIVNTVTYAIAGCGEATQYVIFSIDVENLGSTPITSFSVEIPEIGFDGLFDEPSMLLPVQPGASSSFPVNNLTSFVADGSTYTLNITVYDVDGEHPINQENNTFTSTINTSALICGCTDETACNYDETATTEDNTCVYADGNCEVCNAEGGVDVLDADGDGVCDGDEVDGCTDETACNYDSSATDEDGSCVFVVNPCDSCGEDGEIIDGDLDNDGVCDIDEIAGCQDIFACNYDATATDSDGSCVYADDVCEICDGNGGVVLQDADGDGICDQDEIPGCTDETACNYDSDATDDDGSCVSSGICVDGMPVDCEGNPLGCIADTDGDGVCDECEVPGCTTEIACNYNPLATDNDGTCEFTSCVGCTDPTACNYDPDATSNFGCEYASCDGCMDPNACNYDPDATISNPNNCEYASCTGCTDPDACNYDPDATFNDGCIFPTECEGCDCELLHPGDINCDGVVSTADLLQFLSQYGLYCE